MSKDSEMLGALLMLVTQPELVKKQIISLQQKVSDAENAVRIAKEEQAKAAEAVAEINQRENNAKQAEANLNSARALHEQRQSNLDQIEKELNDKYSALVARENAHKNNLKSLEDRETALRVSQSALDGRAQTLNAEHDKRLAKLDQREKDIFAREELAAAREADLNSKFEKLKAIAG